MTPNRPSSASSDETTTAVSEEHLSTSSSSSISLGSASEPDASTSSSLVLSDSSSGSEPAKPKKRRHPPVPPVRSWPAADEIALLEAAVEHQQKHGRLPSANDLASALRGRLHAEDSLGADQIARRLLTLRCRYDRAVLRVSRGTVPVKNDDVTIYKLSKVLWAGVRKRKKAANALQDPRGFGERAMLYPCLAAEVEAIDPGCGPEAVRVLKRAFGRIRDDTAARLEVKVKRLRMAEARASAEHDRLRRIVAGELLQLIE